MSIILNRLKKSWENDCPEKICSCGKCQENNNEPEFVLKENLSDEEIEEIIEKEYKDKNGYEIKYITLALKKYGNRFSYHNTEFSTRFKPTKEERAQLDKDIIVTCYKHGDFTIKRSKFFKIGCPECIKEGDDLINKTVLKAFMYKRFRDTREYLVNEYLKDSLSLNSKSLILKADFIKLASEERSKDDMKIFDFSLLPDVLTNKTPLNISVKYSNSNATVDRIWKTDFYNFIEVKRLPLDIRNLKDTEEFASVVKSQLEKRHPYLDFSDFEYKGEDASVVSRCKIHNIEVTYSSVDKLLHKCSEYVCPECAKEHRKELSNAGAFAHKTTEEFIAEVEKLYGKGRFDYSLVNYVRHNVPVTLIDLDYDSEPFDVTPNNILRGYGNPYDHMSYGEILVFTSLKKIRSENLPNLDIIFDKIISDEIEGRNTNEVRIDFICRLGLSEIWIEYNGEQHYNPRYYRCMKKHDLVAGNTAYNNQLKRDKNVEKYCSDNNIQLLVIPYTYKDIDSVYDVLYKILVEGKDQNEVIVPVKAEEI